MGTVDAILARAVDVGLTLRVVGTKLEVTGKPTDNAKDLIRIIGENKNLIVTALTTKKPTDQRLPLPEDMYVTGIHSWNEAWDLSEALCKSYRIALGGKPGCWYIVAPVVYTGKPVKDDKNDQDAQMRN